MLSLETQQAKSILNDCSQGWLPTLKPGLLSVSFQEIFDLY